MPLLPPVETTLRIIVGVWILLAGALKFQDYFGFVRIVRHSKLFPEVQANVIGHLMPFVEVFIGLALLLRIWVVPALVIILVKHVMAIIGVVILLVTKARLDNCGCYGSLFPTKLSWTRLIDNLIIVGLCLVLLVSVSVL